MSRSTPTPETVLLQRMAHGDEAALAEVYDRFAPGAYGLALRILRDPALAQDALQDGLLRAWNEAHRFDPARGSARAWLLRVVRNTAIDRLRAEDARRRAEGRATQAGAVPRPAPTGLDAAVESESRSLARTALAELSPEQQRAIELAYFGGLSHSEIADREGLPLGTVKTRIRDGVLRLRSRLGGRDA